MQYAGQILGLLVLVWAALSSALPTLSHIFSRAAVAIDSAQQVQRQTLQTRQNPQTGLPDGLTDVDILEFALTLENLETAFYEQGFAKFPDSDFAALGLKEADIKNLKSIAKTEATHVSTLLSAIAATGAAPVLPCVYDFKFTDAAAMIATAAVLENVGVSAYLAAAPLVKQSAILTVAAEILTVEARHQTFIRTASKAAAIPGAFDTPLGIRAVFSIAANFIQSCPAGSNLAITPFPALKTIASQGMAKAFAGSEVKIESPAATAASATSCAFVNGGQTGGSAFTPFQNGGCVVPMGLTGITYVHLTSSTPPDGILTDAITVAGPLVMTIN